MSKDPAMVSQCQLPADLQECRKSEENARTLRRRKSHRFAA
jgi:hypothetical protein